MIANFKFDPTAPMPKTDWPSEIQAMKDAGVWDENGEPERKLLAALKIASVKVEGARWRLSRKRGSSR